MIDKFERAKFPHKYVAVLKNGKRVKFGHQAYQQYKDSTPLGLYSHKDHLDKKRRARYRKRHAGVMKGDMPAYKVRYSPAWFSWHYLW